MKTFFRISYLNSDIRTKICCLLKDPPWVSDGFEGFQALAVFAYSQSWWSAHSCCRRFLRRLKLHIWQNSGLNRHQLQGWNTRVWLQTPLICIYVGYYVVLKYDEASKIMVPQIAWSSIHLIAGTSNWWNRHLLVRWWLGMILHSLKRIAGDQRDQKTCAPRCFVPCAKPVAMRRHWDHITDGVRVFLLIDSLGQAKQSWLMTKQTHISCFSYFVNLQTSLCLNNLSIAQ